MQFTAVSINSSSLHAYQYCDTKQSFYYHWYIIIVFNISNLIIYIYTVFTLILKSLEVYLTEKSCLSNCWNKTRLIVFILVSVNVYFILSNEYVNCLALGNYDKPFFIENNVVARGGVEKRNALGGERVRRRAGNQWASE